MHPTRQRRHPYTTCQLASNVSHCAVLAYLLLHCQLAGYLHTTSFHVGSTAVPTSRVGCASSSAPVFPAATAVAASCVAFHAAFLLVLCNIGLFLSQHYHVSLLVASPSLLSAGLLPLSFLAALLFLHRFLTACLWSLGSPSFCISLRASSTPTSTTGLTIYGCAAAGNAMVMAGC